MKNFDLEKFVQNSKPEPESLSPAQTDQLRQQIMTKLSLKNPQSSAVSPWLWLPALGTVAAAAFVFMVNIPATEVEFSDDEDLFISSYEAPTLEVGTSYWELATR